LRRQRNEVKLSNDLVAIGPSKMVCRGSCPSEEIHQLVKWLVPAVYQQIPQLVRRDPSDRW
jgi:hypothetical protein